MIKEQAVVNIEQEAKRLAQISEQYFADRAHGQFGEALMEGRISKSKLRDCLRDTMIDHGQGVLKLHTKDNVEKIIKRAMQMVLSSSETSATLSTVQMVNLLLKKAGREEKMVRGRGYYYLTGGEAGAFPYTSMYVYRLENTKQDLRYAIDWLKEVFKDAKGEGRIEHVPDFDSFL